MVRVRYIIEYKAPNTTHGSKVWIETWNGSFSEISFTKRNLWMF